MGWGSIGPRPPVDAIHTLCEAAASVITSSRACADDSSDRSPSVRSAPAALARSRTST